MSVAFVLFMASGWILFFGSLIYFTHRSMHAHEQCIDNMYEAIHSFYRKIEKIDRQISDVMRKMDAILKQ